MTKPIFPFSIHLPSKPGRRNLRLMRLGAKWTIHFLILNAFLGLLFLALTNQKGLKPYFVSFSETEKKFIQITPDPISEKGKLKKESSPILKEDFARSYVLFRESISSRPAETNRLLCDCLTNKREQILIEKTRNRQVHPRCAVCLMSAPQIYMDFQSRTYPTRMSDLQNGKSNHIDITKTKKIQNITSKNNETYDLYEVKYTQINAKGQASKRIALVGVKDTPENSKSEYLFQVI
ncbi:MAG: hypothetical protein JXR30_02330, partial [Alphaproteobacteria bacterium]|nr:hypothetical protein [Alphaproteobacteria bacterium]